MPRIKKATKPPPSNKGQTLPPEPLADDEVGRLMRACSNRAPTGVRNRALIAVMHRCGLRCAEALALAPKDVDHKAGTVRVLHGKGDKARTVGIDDGGLAIVQRWLDVRTARGINGRSVLFCTLEGRPMKTAYVRQLMKRLARKAGIDKRVHAHGLRHSHAVKLSNAGTPMPKIQKALGHSHLQTTARYLDHVNPGDVVEAQRGLVWECDT